MNTEGLVYLEVGDIIICDDPGYNAGHFNDKEVEVMSISFSDKSRKVKLSYCKNSGDCDKCDDGNWQCLKGVFRVIGKRLPPLTDAEINSAIELRSVNIDDAMEYFK